ncbi:MAG: chorismate synthase [Candidatus Hydrogenedentes bacterium]|nr:chorismate synthase [Candidatus Hydrogenedentota bacterium]
MNIVVMGQKGAGKSTVGAELARRLGLPVLDTDAAVEDLHESRTGRRLSCREIFRQEGEAVFRGLEREVAAAAAERDFTVLITGGGLMLDPESRRALRRNAILTYLHAAPETLWERATRRGLPPWLEGEDGPRRFAEQTALRDEALRPFADVLLDTTSGAPEALAAQLEESVAEELAVRQTAANTYGEIIRVTTFGESHGKAIGAVLDGIRPGIPLSEEDVQKELDRRRPGQSQVVTQRRESDTVHFLSGVYEGKTTGAPIAMVIYNEDQRSKNYDNLKDLFRPGHGDFTFYKKYGHRDHRGGGRQSGRETACRVAAGAVAALILRERGVRIVAHAVEVAGIRANTCDYGVIETNPVRCADPEAAAAMEKAILAARSARDSVGGVIQLEILGLPPGLGDPVFGKLDARLTNAIMTIGAVKGVEVGTGFAIARLRGSEANDPLSGGRHTTNHHGGILGGISTGEPVVMRAAVKPTASIAQKQATCGLDNAPVEVEVLGRHDPCIVPRAVPVIEHMAALVILDAWEVQSRLNPAWAETLGAVPGIEKP